MAQKAIEEREHKRFPIIVGTQFQNFSMPFGDMGSNFSHPGLLLGTELLYNQKGTLFQNLTIGAYLNRGIGDGIYLNTQFGFRPKIIMNLAESTTNPSM